MSATVSPAVDTQFETVIGIEVHVQLKTKTKLFCGNSTTFGQEPNSNTCPVCLGYPGVLPVLNQQAVDLAIKLGLAINCDIATTSKFDRKHYFYPDLPKAYQISQFDQPICNHGHMVLSNGRHVRILRAHLEEDAGKLNHVGADGLAGSLYSLVDLNRAGTPLLEIVTEPDIRSAEEAREYMANLRNIVRYLGVCDGNLEEGSMRCDANVSIRPMGSDKLGTKTEVKNMNSLRAIQRAVEYEVKRQTELVLSGGEVQQDTRLWNEATGTTINMRSKEKANDYRYFPEPDLPPLVIQQSHIDAIKATLPELPVQRYERLQSEFGLPEFESNLLTETKELGDYFFEAIKVATDKALAKPIANWLVGDISGYLNAEKMDFADIKLTPVSLVELVELLEANTIGSSVAKKLLPELIEDGGSPKAMVEERGLAQINDTAALEAMVDDVIANNPKQVEQYQGGKGQLIGFFVGQIMKASKGSANPAAIQDIIKAKLGNPSS
jgi:aspartyl-tRNA(Asn)/glutamyl-tRNA(Gln) amidotransferase subunit B